MSTPNFALPPNHPQRSLHHTRAWRTEAEWWESEFGKGAADPDVTGYYPGSPDDPNMQQEREEADVD